MRRGAALASVVINPASDSGGSLYLSPVASGPNPVNTNFNVQVKFVGFFYGVYNFDLIPGIRPKASTMSDEGKGNKSQ